MSHVLYVYTLRNHKFTIERHSDCELIKPFPNSVAANALALYGHNGSHVFLGSLDISFSREYAVLELSVSQ